MRREGGSREGVGKEGGRERGRNGEGGSKEGVGKDGGREGEREGL